MKTVSGKFEKGIVRLDEPVPDLPNGRVLVTFLESDTAPRPLSREELAEIRGKLDCWEEDWSAPGMELYDQP
jgi:hypothetical protein